MSTAPKKETNPREFDYKYRGLEAIARHHKVRDDEVILIGRVLSLLDLNGIEKIDEHVNVKGEKRFGKYDVLVAERVSRYDFDGKLRIVGLPIPEVLVDDLREPVYGFGNGKDLEIEVHVKRQESWRTRLVYKEEK